MRSVHRRPNTFSLFIIKYVICVDEKGASRQICIRLSFDTVGTKEVNSES